MPDFLQLNARGKNKGGLVSLILGRSHGVLPTGGSAAPALATNATPIKDMIGSWLAEDNRLTEFRLRGTPISPELFVDAITKTVNERVCLIAGHAWLEWTEDVDNVDAIHGWAHADGERLEMVNVDLAEFLPSRVFDPDKIYEALETDGRPIEWIDVTDERLRKLFEPLFEVPANAKLMVIPGRDPMGFAPGHVRRLSCDSLRGQSSKWLKAWCVDRKDAYVTPAWEVSRPGETIETFVQESLGWNYSFTPEHYPPPPVTENCVTWAGLLLDQIIGDQWLDTLVRQCEVEPQALTQAGCGPYDVRGRGWMKCVLVYFKKADEKRSLGGLKVFAQDNIRGIV